MSESQQVDNKAPQANQELPENQTAQENTTLEEVSQANASESQSQGAHHNDDQATECQLSLAERDLEPLVEGEEPKEYQKGEPIALPQATEALAAEGDQEERSKCDTGESGNEDDEAKENIDKKCHHTNTGEMIETKPEKSGEEDEDEQDEKSRKSSVVIDKPTEKISSVGTSTSPTIETQEVSSTKNDDPSSSRQMRTSRRPSYNASRSYASGYQNYGLAYLPYKSNFEPSEDARRRADEFFKTLKL